MEASGKADESIKCGNLEKMKNKNFLGIEVWSNRWVVLKRTGLEYFATSRPGEALRGCISTADLKGVDVNTKKRPWGFTVYSKDGTSFEFAAESKDTRDLWVGAIYWLHRDQLVANLCSSLPQGEQSQVPTQLGSFGPTNSSSAINFPGKESGSNLSITGEFQSFDPISAQSFDAAAQSFDAMTITPCDDRRPLELGGDAPMTPPAAARPAAALGPAVTPGAAETLFGKKVTKEDFDYIRVIGEGAHAKVMQVKEKNNGRMLAMKVLNKRKVVDMGQVDNIMIERRVLEQINHPFFVNLHYAFQTKDKLYLVLDFCNGGELFYHMKNEVRFSVNRVRLYAAEIACGLDHMHSMGIIYRDLKPENLLIDMEGHIRFADFGMCKRALMGRGSVRHLCVGPQSTWLQR